jgi:hypothetical protein
LALRALTHARSATDVVTASGILAICSAQRSLAAAKGVEQDLLHRRSEGGVVQSVGIEGQANASSLAHRRVLVVVGPLGQNHLGDAVGQCAEGSTRAAVVHDHAARRQEICLGDEPLDADVGRQGSQFARVLVKPDRHHQMDGQLG